MKQDAIKLREEVNRIPSIIEEVDEEFHELANQTPGAEDKQSKKLVLGTQKSLVPNVTSLDKKEEDDEAGSSLPHVEVSDRLKV